MKNSLLAICCICLSLTGFAKEIKIVSPDGNYQMRVYDREGKVYYSIDYKNKPVILESMLGISSNQSGKAIESDATSNNRATGNWVDNLKIDTVTEKSVDAAWIPAYGERSLYVDLHREYTVDLQQINNQGKRLQIIVRAYNEGIAFRYRFTGNEYLHIACEYTQYTLPEGAQAYFTPRAQAEYELLPLKDWTGESERPLLLELPQNRYALLTEAGMIDFARTKFVLDKTKPGTITGAMYGAVDEIAPYSTPWRVIMAAENAGKLIENNFLLLNLNEACAIQNTGWIRPGKVMREVTLTTEGGKALVDFAVKRNLQYICFDAGWYGAEGSKSSDATKANIDPARNKNPNALNLQEVIDYAKSRNIGVVLYVNQRALYQQLDELLPLYKSWGVSGIKFGFVQVGSQFWTKWLHEAVKKCAEYNLLVDIHDEYRPTGFSRTYPNLMTQEGIYGNEEFPDATHNVTLPFTRFTQGAADYTICYYRQKWDRDTKADHSHGLVNARLLKTTSAHQLAMTVVYYSPLQFVYWYDKPSDSRDEPELEFFDRVPTVWDDTKVIQGEIGQFITIARKSGEDWFIGTMTNNEARRLTVPLDFLPENEKYLAHIYFDDNTVKTRTKVGIKTITVTNKSKIAADLPASGGQAVWLEKVNDTANRNKKFVHPGILHTQKDFEAMRKRVKVQEEPAYGSFLLLKEHKFSQADYQMQGPFRVISRDGEYRYTKDKMEADFAAAYQNALMWMITGDKSHACKSLEILTAYADSLQIIPETNDAPLLAGLEGFKIVYAMELLKHTYFKGEHAGSPLRKIETMFRKIFLPVLENFYRHPPYTNGNWGPIVTKTYMAAGIYFDDRKMYDRAKNFYQHGHDNGTIENYIDGATGQIQESGRDQAHSQLGIGAMAVVCELAWKQGDDLYSALNNKLLKGYEYVAKYNLGDDDLPFRQWTDITGKYNSWTKISDKARGQLRPIFEIAYNHYVSRKRLKMPYTGKVLEKIRPEGFSGDQPPSFGSLLFND
ncbi:MAG: glycoside hydrolase family 97 catalytic domain-containing protein [Dysgonamonadaceae bacterium]|jgi:alpha-glucosidase|nr:glycoside hydrolase family 97 catalytic domain-containing protein [Dysgonamonadaceae bacterium]